MCLYQLGPLFLFSVKVKLEILNFGVFFFFFFFCERLSYPQRPKPISRSSDGQSSFNSSPIGSEGEEIAPVGGWELEF